MAEIIHRGEKATGSIGGEVRIEEGNGRQLFFSGAKRVIQQGRLDSGKIGTDYYKEDTGKNFIRIGTMPDDTGNIIIMRDGHDVDEAFE